MCVYIISTRAARTSINGHHLAGGRVLFLPTISRVATRSVACHRARGHAWSSAQGLCLVRLFVSNRVFLFMLNACFRVEHGHEPWPLKFLVSVKCTRGP